jgi:GAF domain-containing protein
MDAKLTALYDLGQRLILVQDRQQIAKAVLDIAAQVLDLQDSDLLLVDEGRKELYVAARRGSLQGAKNLRLPLEGERGITVAAARRREPLYVPDVRRDPRYVYAGFSAISELAVPVQIKGRVLGVLNVESDQFDAFSEQDRELVSILANQAALALENARLHAQEHRQAEEMILLNELARRIGASLDLQATLEAIVAAAAELIPCALVEASLWDEQRETLTVQAICCDPDRAYPVGKSFPPGKGYTGWLVRHREPLFVPDVDARRDVHPDLLPGERPFKAYAGVPLLASQALVGTLVLVANEAGAFTPGDMRLLQALAHHAAAAIHNARLYEQIARRHQELSALYAVAEAINRPGDLDQILEEGLKRALAVSGLEMGAIAVRDPRSNVLALKSHEGMSPDFVAWLQKRLEHKSREAWPEGQDFLTAELLPALDVPSPHMLQAPVPGGVPAPHMLQAPVPGGVPAAVQEAGIRFLVEIPLFAEGDMVGVLLVATRQAHPGAGHPCTPEERSLLKAIAHQLGTAIANARLRQEALVAERLAAVGRVAASVAHDLRSPLGGILRSAEFLARPELSPATRGKLSQAVVSLARRLINTTQEILDYVRGERLPLRRVPCPVSEFLDQVLAVMEVDFSDRGIEVARSCAYQGPVVMDADRMAQVIYNIAANARDAMPGGGTFTVATQKVGTCVEFRFSDTGPGVPESLADQIFEPFFTSNKREGTGLGLAIARRIVEEHGGALRLEQNDERQGATFVLALPV